MVHPLPWGYGLTPDLLATGIVDLIVGGARAAGTVGDALVVCDHLEQARRAQAGLGGVTSLWLLDAVMNLPLGVPIRTSDLCEDTWEQLRAAPNGVVDVEDGWVTRLLSPPLTVVAAVARGPGWRRPFQLAGRFAPFAQRLMMFDKAPARPLVWEAQVAGVGVWIFEDDRWEELSRPEPFTQRYWKPAGWRFAENAYAAALSAKHPSESFPATADRRVRTAAEESDPRQLVLPLI